MKFRPCIDIHNGKVKQIVGKSLRDADDSARENFAAEQDAAYFAKLFREDGLTGGHVILLNPPDSPYFPATREQAFLALHAFPGGLELGGGVNPDNASDYLEAGASHVIVTSYVFSDGQINWENLKTLTERVGRSNIVLDLSCARREKTVNDAGPEDQEGAFFVVTDRWQKFTDVQVSPELLTELAPYCDEFLIHGVDVEGQKAGMDAALVKLLAAYGRGKGGAGNPEETRPVTYAGGIGSMADLREFAVLTEGNVDFTIGSALDVYGGDLPYREVVQFCQNENGC